MTLCIEARVARKLREATDIASFELVRADGSPLPDFEAGAHIDVEAPGGLVRQYSLCNDPTERHRYVIAVLRDPASRGGSAAMHDGLQEGATLRISAPRNHFALQPAARTRLFAGGIGITPMLCMARQLAAAGADFVLHYCTRSQERTAFQDALSAECFAGRVRFHHDAGPDAQKLDIDQALSGVRSDERVYVCGPGGFIDFVTQGALSRGWKSEQVHVERFTAAVSADAGDTSFEVEVASTGRVFVIPPHQTVARVLQDNGIDVPTSCEQGICGCCLTGVLAGVPDHRDWILTPEDQAKNDQFTPCCSRAKSARLVLDL